MVVRADGAGHGDGFRLGQVLQPKPVQGQGDALGGRAGRGGPFHQPPYLLDHMPDLRFVEALAGAGVFARSGLEHRQDAGALQFVRLREEGGELPEVLFLERLQGLAGLFEIAGHFWGGAGCLQGRGQATQILLQNGHFHAGSFHSIVREFLERLRTSGFRCPRREVLFRSSRFNGKEKTV